MLVCWSTGVFQVVSLGIGIDEFMFCQKKSSGLPNNILVQPIGIQNKWELTPHDTPKVWFSLWYVTGQTSRQRINKGAAERETYMAAYFMIFYVHCTEEKRIDNICVYIYMYIYTHTRAYTHSYAYTYTYTDTELWTYSYFYMFFLLNHLRRNSHVQMYATTELMFTPCIVRYHWWASRPIEFGSLRFPFTQILDGSTYIIITIYIYMNDPRWFTVVVLGVCVASLLLAVLR